MALELHYSREELINLRLYQINLQHSVLYQDFALHTHSFSEIVIIVAGTAKHLLGTHSYPVRRGDVFVIKGSIPHGFCEVNQLEIINLMYDESLFFS